MSFRLSESVNASIARAEQLTVEQNSGIVGEAHFFLALLDIENEAESTVSSLLAVSGVSREEAQLYAHSALENSPLIPGKEPKLSRSAKTVFELAMHESRLDQSPFIESHHLFIACVSHRRGPHLGEVLRPLGLDAAQLREHLRGLKRVERPYPVGNPLNDLTEGAKRAIEAAHAEMRASFCGRISTAHLLLGLLSDEETAATLENAACDLEDLQKRACDSIKSDGEIAMPHKRFSPGAKRALERAARVAKSSNHNFIDCGHLLLALLPQSETLREKWLARERKLECVESLWTAEEALRLSAALRGEAVGKIQGQKQNSFLPFAPGIGFISFSAGNFWAIVLSYSPPTDDLAPFIFGLIVLLPAAVGICGLIALKRTSNPKSVWPSALFGWLVGITLEFLLDSH